MAYQVFRLKNNITLLHTYDPSSISYLSVVVNAGSRDEAYSEHGIAHFTEHMLFKGTKKRKAFQVNNRLEDVGGDLNAFTTKEETCFYATFLHTYYERTIELLSDILFSSTFPEKEIIHEKEVVEDEINSYLDTPSELIFDDFEKFIFKGHPLGRDILGNASSVHSFNQDTIKRFVNKNYIPNQMVICSIGKIPFEKLTYLIQKYFEQIPGVEQSKTRNEIHKYMPVSKTIQKDTFQNHCIMGTTAYHCQHKKRTALYLLNNILGGQGMNSRLNVSLREKSGFSYHVESNYTMYNDTGTLNIYFGTDKKKLRKSQQIVQNEINKLRTTPLGKIQLSKAKKQLKGQLAIARENKENMVYSAGKSYLTYGKIDDLDTQLKKIDSITASQLMEVANEILHPDRLSMIVYE